LIRTEAKESPPKFKLFDIGNPAASDRPPRLNSPCQKYAGGFTIEVCPSQK